MNCRWTFGLLAVFTAFFWFIGYLVQPGAAWFIQILTGLGLITFVWLLIMLSAYFYVNRR